MTVLIIALSIFIVTSAAFCRKNSSSTISPRDMHIKVIGSIFTILACFAACTMVSILMADDFVNYFPNLIVATIVATAFYGIGRYFQQDGTRIAIMAIGLMVYLFADGISWIWENSDFYLVSWFWLLAFYLAGSWIRELGIPKLPATTG